MTTQIDGITTIILMIAMTSPILQIRAAEMTIIIINHTTIITPSMIDIMTRINIIRKIAIVKMVLEIIVRRVNQVIV